jgi:nucleotide-binding universal stress UspA family protein
VKRDSFESALKEEANMIEINHILCPVDLSDCSGRAFARAVALARWYQAQLTVLHVAASPLVDLPPIPMGEREREQRVGELQRFTGARMDDVPVELVVRESADVAQAILDEIAALRADLLVVGSHGRSGVQRLLLGSVAERVVRQAPCPTLVVPRAAGDSGADAAPPFRKLLCAVDFSEGSMRGLTYATSLAEEADARLIVLHVIDVPPELRDAAGPAGIDVDAVRAAAEAAALRRLRELIAPEARTYCTIETAVREGAPHREILKMAADRRTDLIVMGVQGRGAVDLVMFGSNSARVTRNATCATLVVPAGTTPQRGAKARVSSAACRE